MAYQRTPSFTRSLGAPRRGRDSRLDRTAGASLLHTQMKRDLRVWLLSRAPLLFVLVAACLVQRSLEPALPGRDVERFARFLEHSAEVEVRADSIVWAASGGWLVDQLFGRQLLFLGHPKASANDVFCARVRVSRDGHPLEVLEVENLTRTPAGAELGLTMQGERAAYSVFSGGMAQGVTVLDLGGGTCKPERTHVRLPPLASLGIAWRDPAILSLFRRAGPTLRFDAVRRSVEPSDAPITVMAAPDAGGLLDRAARRLRALVGTELFDTELFGTELALRWAAYRHGVDPDLSLAGPAQVLAPPVAPVVTEGSAPWPPPDIPRSGAASRANEGVWVPPSELAGAAAAKEASPFLVTFVHPEPSRPDVRVDLVAADMRRLELRLQAGYEFPHPESGFPGSGTVPRDVVSQGRLRASFNGPSNSVRDDGMMLDGRVLTPPVLGAATVAVSDSGTTFFGTWPPPAELLGQLGSVRQNLEPLVQGGSVAVHARAAWSAQPLAFDVRTERSALCRSEAGQLYYAFGERLSAATLARALERAGCRFAMHLGLGSGHAGFFLHELAGDAALRSGPALTALGRGPERFLEGSRADFFYLVLASAPPSQEGFIPHPGAQPTPAALPAIESRDQRVGSLDVQIVRIRAGRVNHFLVAGDAEPLIAGRPAPVRAFASDAQRLFALNLGHTTVSTRYGLAFQAEATLPLRSAYATLVVSGSELRILPRGSAVELRAGEQAVQLPELVSDGVLSERAREAGALRLRGALCLSPDGHVLIARARHDASDVLALALVSLGCEQALELDRGSQHDVFFDRAGTQDVPRERYDTTVLVGAAAPLLPRTGQW